LDEARGGAVGQGPIGLVPDIFGWVKFWGVGREFFHMEPGVLGDPPLDLPSTMNGAPIPQEDHRPTKMLEQVLQKRPDIQSREIAGPELKIEDQPPAFGRHGQRTDR